MLETTTIGLASLEMDVTLLQMIVMPLIFISIVSAFSKIQIGDKFAKIGSYIFMF